MATYVYVYADKQKEDFPSAAWVANGCHMFPCATLATREH